MKVKTPEERGLLEVHCDDCGTPFYRMPYYMEKPLYCWSCTPVACAFCQQPFKQGDRSLELVEGNDGARACTPCANADFLEGAVQEAFGRGLIDELVAALAAKKSLEEES